MLKNTALCVLPLEMPLAERRVVIAALTMSQERGRSLNYVAHTPSSGRAPDIVIASAYCDPKAIAEHVALLFGGESVTSMQLVMIDGSDAMNASSSSGSRPLTPNGLLECLDRVAMNSVASMRHRSEGTVSNPEMLESVALSA